MSSVYTWRVQWWVELAVVGRNAEHVVYGAILALLQVVEGQGRWVMESGQGGPGNRGEYSPRLSEIQVSSKVILLVIYCST